MTVAVTNLGADVEPIRQGWRVRRADGTSRVVLSRHDTGFAVFDGASTTFLRNPPLGYAGSWTQDVEQAINWAREA